MTVIDDRQLVDWDGAYTRATAGKGGALRSRPSRPVASRPVAYRPKPDRPAVAPLRYHGGGVRMSQVPHTRRPVSTSVSIALAGLAALITVWLGFLAHFSGDRAATPVHVPDTLAVVQVQSGESLQQLAGRIAPQTPVAQVVAEIRELNKLDSASVDAGQTLIAPIG